MLIAAMFTSLIEPPTVPIRTVSPDSPVIVGHQRQIKLGDQTISLLIPKDFGNSISAKNSNLTDLWIHFHGPSWLTFQEHERANTGAIVMNVSVGEGSTIYGKFAEKYPKIQDLFDIASSEVDLWRMENGVTKYKELKLKRARITSFSAGYGAVRNYLKNAENSEKIQSIILCDSLYASLNPANPERSALPEHLAPFANYIKSTKNNEKSFLLSVSSVKTTNYACSEECAIELLKQVSGTWTYPAAESIQAKDPNFPLIRYWQEGSNAILHYGGDAANAHTTHYRSLGNLIEYQRQIGK